MSIVSLGVLFIFVISAAGKPASTKDQRCHIWGKSLREGQSIHHPHGQCMEATCIKNEAVVKKCSSIELLPSNCGVAEVDNSKSYPNCCPVTNCN